MAAIGAIIKKAASGALNKAKNGIKKGLMNNSGNEATDMIKRMLLIKVGIPAALVVLLLACISIILDSIFGTSATSMETTAMEFQESLDEGTFQGDKEQLEAALEIYNNYSSCIGFTSDQIDTLVNDGLKAVEKNAGAYEAYTSRYGTLSTEQKNKITDLANEIKNDSNIDMNDLNNRQADIMNFYNESGEGALRGIISVTDNVTIYEHILKSEKYNFNNITWKSYSHDTTGATELDADDFSYNASLQLVYPTAGSVKVEDLMTLVSPYLMSSKIPLAFLASATYSSNRSGSIGTSVVDNYYNEEQGKNNNIGDFAYQVVKHGQSDIVMNQYLLESRTTSTYWLDYDEKPCTDSFVIEKQEKVTKYYDKDGKEITDKTTTSEVSTKYVADSLKDGKDNPGTATKHVNTRLDESTGQESPAKETPNGDPVYSTSVQYKLASALAFDVKVNNSYDYQKYSDEDADKRINEDAILHQQNEPYNEVTEATKSNKASVETLSSHRRWSDFSNNYNIDTNSKSTGTVVSTKKVENEEDGTYYIETIYAYKYDVKSKEYTLMQGTRYDITRMWSDSLSAEPTSTNKVLLSVNDVINFNKNQEGDYSKTTVTDAEFKEDQPSVDYYNNLAKEENTKINTVDILNSNPKIMLEYLMTSQCKEKYVGFNRGDYTYSQGISIIRSYLNELASENNNTLPYVYGASFGFEVNASAPSSLSGMGSKALLKEFIHAWETGGREPKSNGDKYVVYDDGAGHPTVGYGIDIYHSGFLQNFLDAGYSVEIGAEIDKEFVDGLEDIAIENKTKLVEANTQGLDLTEYQKHALISRAYNWWSNSFRDVYEQYWLQERDDKFGGEPDYTHGLYTNHMNMPTTSGGKVLPGLVARRESEWRLFQTGHYYRAGIMDKLWSESAGGSILEAAEIVHKVMEDEQWSYSVGGTLYWNNIEKSLNNPNKVTCCATFVGASLYYAGIFSEDEMNSYNYNACGSSFAFYTKHGEVITSYDDLEAGDIVFFDYEGDGGLDHVEIYAGDQTWYGAGSTNSIRRDSPYKDTTYWRANFAKAVRLNI